MWVSTVQSRTVHCTVVTVPLLGLILTGEMNQLGAGHGHEMLALTWVKLSNNLDISFRFSKSIFNSAENLHIQLITFII